MGNIPMPFHGLRINTWTLEKKLLIWRTISMSACVIGTAIYVQPLEPYLEAPFFGILVPTFITGYILVHSSDIFLLLMKKDYFFLESCFVVIGGIGSLACGIYQFLKWNNWISDASCDSDKDYDIPELMLGLTFMLHFVSLSAVVVHRILEYRRSSNPDQ